ncbi:DUF6807 domain-containing protein [Gracilibacillus alcaliphilus]|uniref:DUF6807 domain-containing protein n=1 Tax=Gracilibacillus alcaliphilus TaxID=1401441 RepID=UPI00195B86C2|nr:PmoA family protein [Gracilibacillus alcaliphilus]MBM7677531.1 hypothetical protein [Gracilibacillus alcaliphilus]
MEHNHAKKSDLRAESSEQIISIYRYNDSVPIITQHAKTEKRPYIHPMAAPDGVGILTEDAPSHHPWQHGLYCGFNNINNIGFWEEGLRGGYDGTIHPKSLAQPIIKENTARWKVETDWLAPDGTHMISEEQAWTFTDHGETYELDLVWSLQAETSLTYGQHIAGGLFLRMPFKEELGGKAINSAGQENENAEAKYANWVTVSMPIENRNDWAGIAMMNHKDNPQHPVTWRVDDQLGFSPSRCISGEWTQAQGTTETYKHRLFVYCGQPDIGQIERSWNSFNDSVV